MSSRIIIVVMNFGNLIAPLYINSEVKARLSDLGIKHVLRDILEVGEPVPTCGKNISVHVSHESSTSLPPYASSRSRTLTSILRADFDSPSLSDKCKQKRHFDFPIFFLTNARSLVNKFDEFEILLHHHAIDVTVISESWFHPDLPGNMIEVEGYQLFSNCRVYKKGGGVDIYLQSDIDPNCSGN